MESSAAPTKSAGGMHQENLKDLDERETEIMPSTRETAQKYIDFIAALKFAEAFEMLASDAKYRIIGKTPLSKTYSRADLLNVLVPALAEFKQPPTLTFSGTDRGGRPRRRLGIRIRHQPRQACPMICHIMR